MAKTVKTMGASPLTNTIYYGNLDEQKHVWVGKRTDVTDMAIKAVFEWFMSHMEGHEGYSITFPDVDFTLKMARK